MKEGGPSREFGTKITWKRIKQRGGTNFIGSKQKRHVRDLKKREASCELGWVAQSKLSTSGEDE